MRSDNLFRNRGSVDGRSGAAKVSVGEVVCGSICLVGDSLGSSPDKIAFDGSSTAEPNINGAPSCRQKLSVGSA